MFGLQAMTILVYALLLYKGKLKAQCSLRNIYFIAITHFLIQVFHNYGPAPLSTEWTTN